MKHEIKNQCNNTNKIDTINWFENNKALFNENVKVIYLTNKGSEYKISVSDKTNPYGSIKNQVLLEERTIYNLKKYVRNYKIIEYNKKNMGDIINEIIN